MKKLFSLCITLIAIAALTISCEPEITKPNPEHKVGDVITVDGIKGVVFFMDFDGKHGKIVSLEESQINWSTELIATGATNNVDGEENYKAVSQLPNWKLNYPAFYRAFSIDGKGTWYLPAKEEVELLLSMSSFINDALTENGGKPIYPSYEYWSSTEKNSNEAYLSIVDNNGTVITTAVNKQLPTNKYSRPIRKF